MRTLLALNLKLQGKGMCGEERRAELLLCNESGECQQWGALSLEAGQLLVFSVLFQKVLGNCFLLSNMTRLLRMEAEG